MSVVTNGSVSEIKQIVLKTAKPIDVKVWEGQHWVPEKRKIMSRYKTVATVDSLEEVPKRVRRWDAWVRKMKSGKRASRFLLYRGKKRIGAASVVKNTGQVKILYL